MKRLNVFPLRLCSRAAVRSASAFAACAALVFALSGASVHAQTVTEAPSVAPNTGGAGVAQAAPASAPQDQPAAVALDGAYTDFDTLTAKALGATSRAVGFDWREADWHVGILTGELLERNNFGSFRLGGMVRHVVGDLSVEGALNYVFVRSTPSSELLALTPYIQAGRPSRWELDVNVSYPLAEGVVTPLYDILPGTELVFSVTAGARYLFYPELIARSQEWNQGETWTRMETWQETGALLFSPRLSDESVDLLREDTLGGMKLDPALLHVMLGPSLDIYVQPGVYVTGRALFAIPVLNSATLSSLALWPELSFAVGYAF